MSLIKDAINACSHFTGNLMIKSANRGITNAGLPYYTIMFQDISGSIEARKWDATSEDDKILAPGLVVYVEGDVIIYKGKPQMKVMSILSIPQSSVDMKDFIVSCPMSESELKESIDGYIAQIGNEKLRLLVETLIDDNNEKYFSYPAAMTFHHSYHGGIAYHSLSVLKVAMALGELYDFLDKDYLIAGSLLHDIGKTVELSGTIGTNYTTEGKLVGHISIGAEMINATSLKLEIDDEIRFMVTHIILSHHGKPDFGSPVLPQTPEAVVIHYADDVDSKMDILKNAMDETKEGEFSLKLLPFDNRSFYKHHRD